MCGDSLPRARTVKDSEVCVPGPAGPVAPDAPVGPDAPVAPEAPVGP